MIVTPKGNPMNEELRVQYRRWLLGGDLDETVADAILEAMPPYDWHNIARKEDIDRLDSRIDGVEHQLGELAIDVGTLKTDLSGLTANVATLTSGQEELAVGIATLTADVRTLTTHVEADRELIKFIAQGNDRSTDQHLAVMSAVNGIHKQLTAAALTVIIAIAGMVSAGVIAAVQLAAPA